MPSMRVLLVRLFPKLLSTIQNNSKTNLYRNNNNNRMRANPYTSSNSSQPREGGITFSKSHTVQHSNQWENDETSLMPISLVPVSLVPIPLMPIDNLAPSKSNSRISGTNV